MASVQVMSPSPAPPADGSSDSPDGRSVELMLLVRAGDHQAFQELVEMHQHAVIGTCAKMLGSIDEAHDVAQQVFLRVWRAAPRYEPTARFTTWLFTIVRHLVFNETRRRSRRPTVPLDGAGGRESDHRAELRDTRESGPDGSLLQRELEQALEQAIAALPEKQRMAVILRRYEDMAYEEIAEVLRTSLPSVKSLLFRARTQLRQSLREYLDGGSG